MPVASKSLILLFFRLFFKMLAGALEPGIKSQEPGIKSQEPGIKSQEPGGQ
jgi:hypothetical protein